MTLNGFGYYFFYYSECTRVKIAKDFKNLLLQFSFYNQVN